MRAEQKPALTGPRKKRTQVIICKGFGRVEINDAGLRYFLWVFKLHRRFLFRSIVCRRLGSKKEEKGWARRRRPRFVPPSKGDVWAAYPDASEAAQVSGGRGGSRGPLWLFCSGEGVGEGPPPPSQRLWPAKGPPTRPRNLQSESSEEEEPPK